MKASRATTNERIQAAAALMLLALTSTSTLAAGAAEGTSTCDVRDEIHALRESVQELVELLRSQTEQAETEGLVKQILALDQGIVTLDSALREVLRERDEVAQELTVLRGEYSQSAKTVDNAATDAMIRDQLRGYLSSQSERISQREERLAHLGARANELRDTIRQRQLQSRRLEKRLDQPGVE